MRIFKEGVKHVHYVEDFSYGELHSVVSHNGVTKYYPSEEEAVHAFEVAEHVEPVEEFSPVPKQDKEDKEDEE